MRLILNGQRDVSSFDEALSSLLENAHSVSAAVSYIQVGGWDLFSKRARHLDFGEMRIVCTDQFDITQPAAIRRALAKKVQIRNFTGSGVYHPKVFITEGRAGVPSRFLLGSANLSTSAFSKSYEAGILGEDAAILRSLNRWFDDLYSKSATPFTSDLLKQMDSRWEKAAAQRIWRRTQEWKSEGRKQERVDILAPEDSDVLEDILATLRLPLGLLNIDYAANNVRSLDKVMTDLANPNRAHSGKTRSELKLLGLMTGSTLTKLGRDAQKARTPAQVARIWCAWIKSSPEEQLRAVNERLVSAKRVFARFWKLKPEVIQFFLTNVENKRERGVLQTIELLCNGRSVVQSLSIEEFRMLSQLLRSEKLPAYIRSEIREYEDNKGTRGWNSDDRRTMVNAWQEV